MYQTASAIIFVLQLAGLSFLSYLLGRRVSQRKKQDEIDALNVRLKKYEAWQESDFSEENILRIIEKSKIAGDLKVAYWNAEKQLTLGLIGHEEFMRIKRSIFTRALK